MNEEYFVIETLQYFIGRAAGQFPTDYLNNSYIDYLMSELTKMGVDTSKLEIGVDIDDEFTTVNMTLSNDYTKHLLHNKTREQIERILKLDSLFG